MNKKKCKPCEGSTDPFTKETIDKYLALVDGWSVSDSTMITKSFTFKNFKNALEFVIDVGEIAEDEGHHPDINLHDYKKVTIQLWTHAIKGLSENDFIIAHKIDQLGRMENLAK